PATAIKNSALGVGASRRICAIPPKMKRVIWAIGILYRMATRQCPSSCTKTEAKSRSAASAPSITYSQTGSCGTATGKYQCDSDETTRAHTTKQKTCPYNRIQNT